MYKVELIEGTAIKNVETEINNFLSWLDPTTTVTSVDIKPVTKLPRGETGYVITILYKETV
jgi:hypothetical protein